MSESTSPMILGTLIFSTKIEGDMVKYIALKINSLWDRSRWNIHIGECRVSGKHSIAFTYKLTDDAKANLMVAEVHQLLKKLLQARSYSDMRENGLIDWLITDNVTEP